MIKNITLKLILIQALLALPIFGVFAENGSVPNADSETAPAIATATSAPRAGEAEPPPVTDVLSGGTSEPTVSAPTVPVAVETPALPAPVPAAMSNLETSENQINEEDKNNNTDLWIALAVFPSLLLGYALTQLIRKKDAKEKEKENSRCSNIKSLMEKKFDELTNLRSQLENKAEKKIREKARDVFKETSVRKILGLVESAEKEYGRLKKLYEECIIEVKNTKRVFIVHGWSGYPEEGWFPWLKKELEKKGFEVQVPKMPEPDEPKIESWVSYLAKVVQGVDEKTYFVGHSIGCQTILRYLEGLPTDKKVGGAIFVAGWFMLSDLETEEEKIIGEPWVLTPIDFNKVKAHTQNFFAVFSSDDEVIPIENKELFEKNLGAKILVEDGRGHFSGSDGVKELPSALQALLEMAKMD